MNSENYEIILGDCFDTLKGMQNQSVEMLLTDIPYGEVNKEVDNGYGGIVRLSKGDADVVTFDLDALIREFIRVTRGTLCVFCGTQQVSRILQLLTEAGFSSRILVAEKTNPFPANPDAMLLSAVEVAAWGKRQGAMFNGHCRPNIFRCPTSKAQYHPTEKNVELMKDLISLSTKPGDLVFDPMMGSGTTGVAAIEKGRKFIGCEISEEWYNKAAERLGGALEWQYDTHEISKVKSARIKMEVWRQSHYLREDGWTVAQISRELGRDTKTISKYLSMSEDEFTSSNAYLRKYDHRLDAYETILRDKLRRERALTAAQVWRWIQEAYPELPVSQKTVYNEVKRIREKYKVPKR